MAEKSLQANCDRQTDTQKKPIIGTGVSALPKNNKSHLGLPNLENKNKSKLSSPRAPF